MTEPADVLVVPALCTVQVRERLSVSVR